MSAPAGWYPDPERQGLQRHWNGEAWTNDRRATPSPRAPLARRRMSPHAILASALGVGAMLILTIVIVVSLANRSEPISSAAQYSPAEYDYLVAVRDIVNVPWSADVESHMLETGHQACDLYADFPDIPRSEMVERARGYGAATDERLAAVFAEASAHLCPR
ncbi:DUF2510 domain-containing protein [Microbacterium sp. 5K110]|jgi:hypothetical protein|uniref:DUF2510 domain-containing protein n=1 Tax=unclassified Microbacterium TaxID=2609290 RepID=UPI00148536EA|nr:DUF2510 domain-containing protein [Microbacterium sp. 5K110]